MQYKTILFDLDDTLIDTAANSREALNEIYKEYPFDQYYKTFEDFWDVYMPYNLSLWDAYELHEVTKEELMSRRFFVPFKHVNGLTPEKAMDINNDFLKRTSSKSNVIEGSYEILEELKKHYKICVLSNGFEEVQDKKINSAKMDKYFDRVILSDNIGINKPDTRIFEYALREMDTNINEAIMIGDNWSSDIIGAYNSNIHQVWYNPKNKNTNGFTPTYIIQKLNELHDILLTEK